MQSPPNGISVCTHGAEQEPVVIIDDFFPSPQPIQDYAKTAPFAVHGAFYPGVRAPFDPSYLRGPAKALHYAVTEVFGFKKNPAVSECFLSIVTTPPAGLQPAQRRAHFDCNDGETLAILHYLCDEADGGTSFYRHRATGFETITEERRQTYLDTVEHEERQYGEPPQGYLSGTNHQFEQIASYGAKFNRAIIYRGYSLHSGDISNAQNFDAPLGAGRLTVNSFITVT